MRTKLPNSSPQEETGLFHLTSDLVGGAPPNQHPLHLFPVCLCGVDQVVLLWDVTSSVDLQ